VPVDGERGENAPALRHQCQAALRDLVRPAAGEFVATEDHHGHDRAEFGLDPVT
jgi:hypothetical protein